MSAGGTNAVGPASQWLRLWTDGAARGNPGPAGAGVVLLDEGGRTVVELARPLGETTNNVAEYTALQLGLKEALRRGAQRVEIFLDSELVVRQVEGRYRVRQPHLKPRLAEVRRLLGRFESWSIQYVPREQNRRADQLANLAIDGSAHFSNDSN